MPISRKTYFNISRIIQSTITSVIKLTMGVSITRGFSSGMVAVIALWAAGTGGWTSFTPRWGRQADWPHAASHPSQTETLFAGCV